MGKKPQYVTDELCLVYNHNQMPRGPARRRSSRKNVVYPKKRGGIGKGSRLKANVPAKSAQGLSYVIEKVACVIDRHVVFDYDNVENMPPFTFQFGMYTAYPLFSADGAALQVFPCMQALDRWTEIQLKSISA